MPTCLQAALGSPRGLVLLAELLASAARVAVFQHVAELIEASHPFKDKGHNVRVLRRRGLSVGDLTNRWRLRTMMINHTKIAIIISGNDDYKEATNHWTLGCSPFSPQALPLLAQVQLPEKGIPKSPYVSIIEEFRDLEDLGVSESYRQCTQHPQ